MWRCPDCGTQTVNRDGEYCIFCEPSHTFKNTDGNIDE